MTNNTKTQRDHPSWHTTATSCSWCLCTLCSPQNAMGLCAVSLGTPGCPWSQSELQAFYMRAKPRSQQAFSLGRQPGWQQVFSARAQPRARSFPPCRCGSARPAPPPPSPPPPDPPPPPPRPSQRCHPGTSSSSLSERPGCHLSSLALLPALVRGQAELACQTQRIRPHAKGSLRGRAARGAWARERMSGSACEGPANARTPMMGAAGEGGRLQAQLAAIAHSQSWCSCRACAFERQRECEQESDRAQDLQLHTRARRCAGASPGASRARQGNLSGCRRAGAAASPSSHELQRAPPRLQQPLRLLSGMPWLRCRRQLSPKGGASRPSPSDERV
mmetsp:Transcript_1072/g.3849  ORF Transcript_1072/g.3849 Transcript_1072/m.3849 type:complete len:333 (+) Transcript_1072:317-1315(+)